MLSNTLVTNEIKNASGAEREFERISIDGKSTVFRFTSELTALPHRMTVSHSRTGKGKDEVRRSVVRFDKTNGDDVSKWVTSAYIVLVLPEGHTTDSNDAKEVLANLMSFMASLGANTTILYDCTGSGAATLLNESL